MGQTVKLLLVDDEPLALRRIRSFQLAARGFEIVGEAENGMQALQSVERLKPDIVVTDIGMPVMDGLELLQQLQQRPSPPKVVLLTCYEDFDKVQTALRYGAGDYLTKVMLSEEELVHVLERTAASLRKEHVETELIVRALLQDVLLFPSEQTISGLWKSGFVHDRFAMAVIRTAAAVEDALAEEWFAVEAEETERERGCIPVRLTPDTWCLYFHSMCRENDASFYGWYSQQCSKICVRLRSKKGLADYVVAAGAVYHRTADLPLAYQRSLAQCEAGFYMPCSHIVWEETAPAWSAFPQEQFRSLLENIGDAIQRGEGTEAGSLLTEWADAIGRQYRPPAEQVRQMARAICSQLEGVGGRANAQLLSFKQTAETALHAAAIVCEARHLADTLGQLQPLPMPGSMRKEIKKAIALIASQYTHIELIEVARQVSLSPSCFAALFRAETGQSFHDYVQQVRLNEARVLLRTTDLKVYEIADRVGIPNSRYFSRLFSEYAGFTPLDYRKNERSASFDGK
ncbi:response regulator [Paenibacillus sp. GCM10027626]|uniref:response regulator n=1 Tax=Paenibacillus sp. GCM10027626 TaxID=3273411 RepID=UPI0036356B21